MVFTKPSSITKPTWCIICWNLSTNIQSYIAQSTIRTVFIKWVGKIHTTAAANNILKTKKNSQFIYFHFFIYIDPTPFSRTPTASWCHKATAIIRCITVPSGPQGKHTSTRSLQFNQYKRTWRTTTQYEPVKHIKSYKHQELHGSNLRPHSCT